MMASAQQRQLVIALEGTSALGPAWPVLLVEYIEKIVRAFCGLDGTGQKLGGASGEMALVVFHNRGSHNGCLLQRSGWTSSLDVFLQWLSSITFVGGGYGEAAVAEALAEALLMCCPGPVSSPTSQGMDRQKHCVLVAASNPSRLKTAIPSLPAANFMQSSSSNGINGELQSEHWWLADADMVAQVFSQCSVSLSIVAPRQLPLLRNVYSQARRNPRNEVSTDSPKQYVQHLVLLSECFLEARMAVWRVGSGNAVSSGVLPVKLEPHQSPSLPVSSVSGQMSGAGVRPPSAPISGVGIVTGRPGNNSLTPVQVKLETGLATTTGTLNSLLHNNGNPSLPQPMQHSTSVVSLPGQDTLHSSLGGSDVPQDFELLGAISSTQPIRSVVGALPNSNLLVNSPSQSRHAIGSPSLPPSSPLSNLQSSAGGVPVANIMSAIPGSNSLSVSQSSLSNLGVGQSGTVNPTGLGVGQGGIGISGFSSGTLVSNTNLGPTQPTSLMNSGAPTSGQAVISQGSVSMVQGGLSSSTQIGQGGLGAHGVLSGLPQGGASSSTGTMIPTPGIAQSPSQVQAHGASNAVVPTTVHAGSTPPQQPAAGSLKYTKLWEGILAGQRKGNAVPICKLEGYRQMSSPDTLAMDWPPTMQIMRLIPQDLMSDKDHSRKAELLVFRPTTQHDFLVQLAEKKLCAVIQLPSQTLLLASADKPGRMIGMLFPGDVVNIKPQLSIQQQQQQQTSVAGNPQTVSQVGFAQSQLAGQQPRPQLMSAPGSLHGTGFLP